MLVEHRMEDRHQRQLREEGSEDGVRKVEWCSVARRSCRDSHVMCDMRRHFIALFRKEVSLSLAWPCLLASRPQDEAEDLSFTSFCPSLMAPAPSHS
eukprot:2185887-Rhodomonas_salina.3